MYNVLTIALTLCTAAGVFSLRVSESLRERKSIVCVSTESHTLRAMSQKQDTCCERTNRAVLHSRLLKAIQMFFLNKTAHQNINLPYGSVVMVVLYWLMSKEMLKAGY